jgi:hypothetical protein
MDNGGRQAGDGGDGLLVIRYPSIRPALGKIQARTWNVAHEVNAPYDADQIAAFQSIAANGGTIVAVGALSTHARSTDGGRNWQHNNVGTSGGITRKCIAFGSGLFVAGRSGGVSYSADGTSFTQLTLANSILSANGADAIVYGNGQFVAVGGGSPSYYIATSPDGTAWTNRVTAVGTATAGQYFNNVRYLNDQYIACGTASFNRLLKSSDGITWSSVGTGIGNPVVDVTWDGANYLVLTSSNLYKSPTLTNSSYTAITPSGWGGSPVSVGIASAGNITVLALTGGASESTNCAYVSSDAEKTSSGWSRRTHGLSGRAYNGSTVRTSGATHAGKQINYINNAFFIVAENGIIMTCRD